MKINESFRYAWKEIRKRKRRASYAILSYVIVGAIIVVISSLASTTRDTIQSVLWDIGAHSVAYVPRLTIEGCCIQKYATDFYDPDREGFIVNNAPTNIIPAELIEKIQQSPNVEDAAPYLLFRIRSSISSGEWLLGGIDLTRPKAYSATVVAENQVFEGEFLKPDDQNLIMVERDFASVNNLNIGSDLLIGDRMFKITAIVQPPLRPGKANIYMTLNDLREIIVSRMEEPIGKDISNAVLIESKGAINHEQALQDINAILGQSSRITSYGCSQPGILAMGINDNTARTIIAVVVLSMFLIAMKIQYSSVLQRRYDISILKAVGWKSWDVVTQIMVEALIYSFTGGLLGVLIGYTFLLTLPDDLMSFKDTPFNTLFFLIGISLPIMGGLLSGLFSSVKAFRMQTAEILRML